MQQGVYLLALLLVLALVHHVGLPSLVRTGWAMAANLALVWISTWATQSYAPWLWFVAIDIGTAFMVLARPAGRAQALIGAIFVMQIITHIAFGASGTVDNARLYLDLLAFGGGCQLLILATGAIHGRRRKNRSFGAAGSAAGDPAAPHLARVEVRP